MYRSKFSMWVATAAIAVTLGVTKDSQNPTHGPGISKSDILIAEDTIPQTQQGSDKTPPVPGAKDADAKPSTATPADTKSDKQPDSKAPPQ